MFWSIVVIAVILALLVGLGGFIISIAIILVGLIISAFGWFISLFTKKE